MDFWTNAGPLGELLCAIDWQHTPLGPQQAWPPAFRTALQLLLGHPIASAILWGPSQILLYNEAFCALIRDKHPQAFGRPARESVSELFPLDELCTALAPDGVRSPFFQNKAQCISIAQGLNPGRFALYASPVLLQDSTPGGVLLTLIDACSRNETSSAGTPPQSFVPATNEAELRKIQRLAQVGSWAWDVQTDTVTWSEELYRIAGRDPSLAPPRYEEHPRLYSPESFSKLNAAVQAALQLGLPYELELQMLRPDGTSRWIIARGEVERDDAGHPIKLRGTSQDITERKRAELALRQLQSELEARVQQRTAELWRANQALSEEIAERKRTEVALSASQATLDAFFAAAPGVLNLFDDQLRYINTDTATPTYFGLDRTSIVGRLMAEVAPQFDAHFGPMMREVIQTGKPQLQLEVQGPVPTRGGEIGFFSASYFPVPLANGRHGLGCMAVEITDIKRSELALRQLQIELEDRVKRRTEELAEANRELEAFSYSVSHDLRAPLRHVQAFIQLLEKNSGPQLDEKGQHYIQVISQAARRMGQLIDDLLTLSRVGRAAMAKATVDLGQLVEEARQELAPDLVGRTVEWHIVPLPTVCGDPALLRAALVNLLSNALKYTRPRAGARIELGSREQDGQVLCYVRDNGVGFDMRFVDKLFGPFQRLHRAEEFEGTGIGLSTVRRIIQRHGGKTWAEGEVDRGATFYFSLPIKDHP